MKTFVSAFIICLLSLSSCHSIFSDTVKTTVSDTVKTTVLFVSDTKTGQGVVCNAFRVTATKKTIDTPSNKVMTQIDTTYYVQWLVEAKDSTGKPINDSTGKPKKITIFPPVDKKYILTDYQKSFF